MSIKAGPDMVKDGLVVCLDAADRNSYSGSGNIWYDLSGNNNNGTLINNFFHSLDNGGGLVFDGVNNYIELNKTGIQLGIPNNSQMTVETYINVFNLTNYVHIVDCASNRWHLAIESIADGGSAYFWNGTTYHLSSSPAIQTNTWYHLVGVQESNLLKIYINSVLATNGSVAGTPPLQDNNVRIGMWQAGSRYFNGNISSVRLYNRALSQNEVRENYNASKARFTVALPQYEKLTYIASSNLTVTGNGTNTVNIFKTSGANDWNNHAYSSTPFTAPCTIEFNKQAAAVDNGASYAMIGWNSDPLTTASYDTLDYASFPYATNNYSVYHNANQVHFGGTWSTENKFYIVYGIDGTIKHYNGSTLLYSVNYGIGNTVYVDSSFHSVNTTFGGFSNIKVRRSEWNGTFYV